MNRPWPPPPRQRRRRQPPHQLPSLRLSAGLGLTFLLTFFSIPPIPRDTNCITKSAMSGGSSTRCRRDRLRVPRPPKSPVRCRGNRSYSRFMTGRRTRRTRPRFVVRFAGKRTNLRRPIADLTGPRCTFGTTSKFVRSRAMENAIFDIGAQCLFKFDCVH